MSQERDAKGHFLPDPNKAKPASPAAPKAPAPKPGPDPASQPPAPKVSAAPFSFDMEAPDAFEGDLTLEIGGADE